MMFNPYLLYIKIAACLALIAGVLFGAHEIADHWREQGRQEIQVKWNADKEARELAQKSAIDQRIKENIAALAANEAKNQGAINELRRTSELQNNSNQRVIADLKSSGGLRVSTDYCSGSTGQADTASTEGNHGQSSTRLPEQIETGLFNFANDRDQEIILLGQCQKWIINNGFYSNKQGE